MLVHMRAGAQSVLGLFTAAPYGSLQRLHYYPVQWHREVCCLFISYSFICSLILCAAVFLPFPMPGFDEMVAVWDISKAIVPISCLPIPPPNTADNGLISSCKRGSSISSINLHPDGEHYQFSRVTFFTF